MNVQQNQRKFHRYLLALLLMTVGATVTYVLQSGGYYASSLVTAIGSLVMVAGFVFLKPLPYFVKIDPAQSLTSRIMPTVYFAFGFTAIQVAVSILQWIDPRFAVRIVFAAGLLHVVVSLSVLVCIGVIAVICQEYQNEKNK